ncbi:type I restriction enzyme subunit R domain-containing protein [Janthinobacterium sp. EB271-G4-7A]|uniref:type I restriction enzyme subunit R domain-containing protein n=1 Tax=Janthinobacterium sp. EB271-G4-7A TaxID=2775056 RepID=UPI001E621A34|nr:DEAD/DEAH box helicase family protein [Janthinobacterium sp. EB271-G4-7A]MCC7697098.1 type I restriction endonuclease subunit R [Janthinobacterium sp. EB271-G4-7A]
MASHGFKESDFQNGVFLPFLTGSSSGQLDWILGKASDIDGRRWIVGSDLLAFLRAGNELNALAFREVAKRFDTDEECLDAFIDEALLPKLESAANAAFVLRESIVFREQPFSLWNEAPRAGASSEASDAFARNALRAIPEATFERLFPFTNGRVRRRPDCVFFVNGVYFAYSELKTAQTGQTAATHGRKKIAHNCVEASVAALREARARWEHAGGKWPGFRSRSMPVGEKNRIRQDICLYEKAVHISSVDMGGLLTIQDMDWVLADVDDAIERDDRVELDSGIPSRLVDAFSPAADIRDKSPSASLADHLTALFHPIDGIDREVFYFNQVRPKRTTTGVEILRPRAAQRAMLFQSLRRVEELYAHEQVPKLSETMIRERLAVDLPELDPAKVDKVVSDTMLHRNGADSHSILLQGAAGLGKTNVMVWLAQALADMPDARSKAAAPLFDACILLTDRTELRKNVAEEAARLKSTRGIVSEAETFSQLREALEDGARVVVVNIQKFPSLKRFAADDPKLAALMLSKRVAFVIDEVHRSQNGVLHDAAIEVFDEWGTIRPVGAKRNLIIGLTATPKDEILARIGEWRSPASPGDDIRWAPYFAYTMAQAIREKVILNPIQNIVRFGDHIDYKVTASIAGLGPDDMLRPPSVDEIYGSEARQRMVARQAALVFAAKTMMAIRPVGGRALGEGKALFAAHSIKAAIAYQSALQEEIRALAHDPRFAGHAMTLEKIEVLVLFTDKQGEPSCASRNGGRNQEQIIDAFRRKGIESESGLKVRNSIIVVVDKLLTGFDEPTLHTVFIDRGMDDVLLFQTACRINRSRKWKNDCLIVDFSHDGVVSKNLPKVFAKYGGLTVSAFDALDLMRKMDAAYCAFFKDADLLVNWKAWKAAPDGGKDGASATALSDFLERLVDRDRPRAIFLRQMGASWLSSRSRLRGILDFARPELARHGDEQRAAFAAQVVAHLAARTRDADDRIAAVFEVDMVEEAEGWGLEELPEPKEPRKKKEGGKPSEPRTPRQIAESLELLTALQFTEQQKLALIEKLKAFLLALFKAMDKVGQSRNQDIHRKMILAMAAEGEDMPWEERFVKFKELLDAANAAPEIYTHPDRKAFMAPMMKRAELVMADYEEWIVDPPA